MVAEYTVGELKQFLAKQKTPVRLCNRCKAIDGRMDIL